jgi:3-mercaptopropionate dioxygenase
VDAVPLHIADIPRVRNAFGDCTSIAIRVYGGNIGAVKHSVHSGSAGREPFVSGYANNVLPNLWNVSKEPTIP